ncbi:hypothetical protein MPTK1_2g02020 [Marchantia polymorpha subsp. ruderalis]|uniref:Magnesium transporter CorA-like family protein n=1 Tax=Marchantia polymorpha TaxID=3197 RepID=A0A2R6W870_MARPO|nr:hypothetical protein MARPO_0130s0010 [Marchantia polymorpha]BBN00776.1 hypothetical protein Mp_2g02020 [Marchantia polymorpha subsp. ruderalis]|eukprot:PTQ30053.1 hypothetical protein MARPO_0130s0010 [Marchantia polymorpha]
MLSEALKEKMKRAYPNIPKSMSSPDIPKSHTTKPGAVCGHELWVDGLILAYEFIPAPKNKIKVGGKFGQKSGPMKGNFNAEITLRDPRVAEGAELSKGSPPEPGKAAGAGVESRDEQRGAQGSVENAPPGPGEDADDGPRKKEHNQWVPIGWERLGELVQIVQANILTGRLEEMMDDAASENGDFLSVADQAAPYWQSPAGPTWWCHVDPRHSSIVSWLSHAQWLHPAISTALRDESRLISDRMKHLYYEVPVRVAGGILFELLGQSVGDPHRNEEDVPIVLRSWASQNFLLSAMHVKGEVPSLNVIGISEVQDIVGAGGMKAPKTAHEVIALLADRLARWDDRLFRKHYFGEADEVELKFVSRRDGEDLAILSMILNQEIRRLSSQVIRVKWSLHAREEIMYELMAHLRGKNTQSILESIRKSTRAMLGEQEAVRDRLFTVQDVMQATVRASLQDKSVRIQHNLAVIGGPGLLLSIIAGLFGINVGGIPGSTNDRAFLFFSLVFFIFGAVLIAVGMIYLGFKKLPTEEQLASRKLELQDLVKHFQKSAESHEKVRDVVDNHQRSSHILLRPNSEEYILIT